MNKEYNYTNVKTSSVHGCLEDALNLSKAALNQVGATLCYLQNPVGTQCDKLA